VTTPNQRAEALEKRLFALWLAEQENKERAARLLESNAGEPFAYNDASQELLVDFCEDLRYRFCEFVAESLQNPTPVASHGEFVSGLCLDEHDRVEELAQATDNPRFWENEALWASAAYNLQEVDD